MKKTIDAPDFDLRETLDSGQLFRWWDSPDGGFVLAVGDRIFPLRQQGDRLETWACRPEDGKFIRHFFSLDIDLEQIRRALIQGGLPGSIVARWRGLRIVRQSPWECLASFVCSSANNILRIRGMLQRLCATFGRPIETATGCDLLPSGRVFHSFPPPEDVGNENSLRKLGFGFRAAYLARIARLAADGWLDGLENMDYEGAKARLVELPGVGAKVADCVLLFSLNHGEAFPIDTWMRRAARELFFDNAKVSDAVIHRDARERFGKYAGYAQQYIYHEWRRKAGRNVRADLTL